MVDAHGTLKSARHIINWRINNKVRDVTSMPSCRNVLFLYLLAIVPDVRLEWRRSRSPHKSKCIHLYVELDSHFVLLRRLGGFN